MSAPMRHSIPRWRRCCRGQTGAQTVKSGSRTMVVGYAPIPLHSEPSSLVADESWEGWGLLTIEYWDDIVSPLRPYVLLMSLLLLVLIACPVVILAMVARRIIAPLQSLVTQVEKVAEGEFGTQVSINAGPSEVQELEIAFNQMVDQLRKYRRDIQNYVVSILNSQEQERKRIARELHDETAQAIIVLGRRIEMAQELAASTELSDELESLRDHGGRYVAERTAVHQRPATAVAGGAGLAAHAGNPRRPHRAGGGFCR